MNRTDRCKNAALGALLPQYEMGTLTEVDRDRFEEHLLECGSCFHEVEVMLPVAGTIRFNNAQLRADLRREGLTFDALRAELLSEKRSARQRVTGRQQIANAIEQLRERFLKPIILAPAAAVAMTGILLLTLIGRQPVSPYLPILVFDQLPYREVAVRGDVSEPAREYFEAGMREYQLKDYSAASSRLKKAVALEPAHGLWWLYLGTSYYLDRKPDAAIDALKRATALTDYDLKNFAQWYLAQAYLLKGKASAALPLLTEISRGQQPYAAQADTLAAKVMALEKK